MRVIAASFGPYAPDALTSHVSVFSHDFKRLERFAKLAPSSVTEGDAIRQKVDATRYKSP
jgi:hypothetical protein